MNNNLVRVVGVGRRFSLDPASEALLNASVPRIDGGTVQRIQRTLALERRWTIASNGPQGTEYRGNFHAHARRIPGKAIVSRSAIDVFVRDVPSGLKKHREWLCFRPRSDGWFWVHHTKHASLDAAILEIEAILTESIQLESENGSKHLSRRPGAAAPWLLNLGKLLGLFS
jgi:hypothetical protein